MPLASMLTDSLLLLGLDEHALVQDVKDAYRRLARLAHPDVADFCQSIGKCCGKTSRNMLRN